MATATRPRFADLPLFFAAEATPFFRSHSTALGMSPPSATSAFLQSIIGAFVMSRSFLTSAAGTLGADAGDGGGDVEKSARGSAEPAQAIPRAEENEEGEAEAAARGAARASPPRAACWAVSAKADRNAEGECMV
jgi:hypothetical protein